MREIKFRAWDNHNKEWVYSNLMPDIGFWKWVAYDSTTVFNEWTGLKDREDVEIYEGDVVEDSSNRYKIIYHTDGFYLHNIYEPENILLQLRHSYLLNTVIGNIYENPELLEEL